MNRSILALVIAGCALATPAQAEPGFRSKVAMTVAGCGQLFTGHITLSNIENKSQPGHIELTVQGHTTKVPFDLAPHTNEQKFDITSSHPLSCKDGLGKPTFTVFKDGDKAGTIPLTPKGFKGDQFASGQGPANRPWIRHVGTQGTCGSPGAVGSIDLYQTSPAPITLQGISVDFAGASSQGFVPAPVVIEPNTVKQLKAVVPQGINCEANGIPAVKFTFPQANAPAPTHGSLEPGEIVFEP